MRTIAVIQARMGSTRLPGKVLEPIEGRALIDWTIEGISAIAGLEGLVVAITTDASDDPLAAHLVERGGVDVHRGPVHDVLRRVVEAVRPGAPDVVVRQTADNPFPDPLIMRAQLDRLVEGPFDYVGIAGLPLGIGAEAVTWAALEAADREATDAAEREHVLPFVYTRPERFRIGTLASPTAGHGRYTVDTPADLAFARAVAARLVGAPPTSLGALEAVVAAEPGLRRLNAGVGQKDHHEAELAATRRQEAG